MTPPVLRPYQGTLFDELRASLRQHRRTVLQSPTGSGKSILIAYMIGRTAERGESAWLVCHRKELLDQLSATLWAAGVSHGVISSERNETKDLVQIATVQTLVRRLHRLPPPKLLAIDEVHHAAASSWKKVIVHCASSWIVGLTATPERLDGQGLGDLFNDLVLGPTVPDLTEHGYLAPYRIFAPATDVDLTGVHSRGGDWVRGELREVVDQSAIVGDAVGHYQRLVAPGNCLVYCIDRSHAHHVEDAYRAAGIDARYCAGDTPKAEREAIVRGLPRCQPAVVVSVDLFGEGLDVPGLRAVQLLRPTQSLGLYLQQVGRCLRPEDGKDHAIVLDHVRNCVRHGFPDDPREWSLEGRKKAGATEATAPALRNCPECFCVFRAILGACPQCGWVPTVEARQIEHVDGELLEIDRQKARDAAWKRQEVAIVAGRDGFPGVVRLAIERSYRFGWAARYWTTKARITPKDAYRLETEVRKELKREGSRA